MIQQITKILNNSPPYVDIEMLILHDSISSLTT